MTADNIILLRDLPPGEVPEDLQASSYFDFEAHPFAHRAIVDQANSIPTAIQAIHEYAVGWLKEKLAMLNPQPVQLPSSTIRSGHFNVILGEGAEFLPSRIIGSDDEKNAGTIVVVGGANVHASTVYLDQGDIYVGAGTTVEDGTGLKGPCILGANNDIRQGAYVRGDCILGDNCVIRGEIKNVIMMDQATFPHPCYVGDSICGFRSHFGNQATAANFGLYEGARDADQRQNIVLKTGGEKYDIGKSKLGICMGDFVQVGCNAVSDPGTFLKPYTIAYPLSRISKGFYGPRVVLKNKPMEHGVIEQAPLDPLD